MIVVRRLVDRFNERTMILLGILPVGTSCGHELLIERAIYFSQVVLGCASGRTRLSGLLRGAAVLVPGR
jgi:hypothetical protein